MPNLTIAQEFRLKAAKLVMENCEARILIRPWTTIDQMTAYLRYGDPEHPLTTVETPGSKSAAKE